jgi:hypothetical protein
MFRTFAVKAGKLEDAEERRRWDRTLADFENEVFDAGFNIGGMTTLGVDGMLVVAMIVTKTETVPAGAPGQYAKVPGRLTEEEFEATSAKKRSGGRSPAMPGGRSPRVLEG